MQIDTGTEQLACDLEDRVLTITLNRPEARNALSPELTGALRAVLSGQAGDASIGAVVVTGAGGAFCAGGDVKGMAARKDDGRTADEKFRDMRARHHEIAGALRALRIPTIAALPGPAAGAGLAIALACDLRIATEGAFVSAGYARVGLSGDYGFAWLLTRVVGPARARELMLTSARVDAARGLEIGLFNQVVPAAGLAEATRALADPLANGPRVAFAYMKDNLDEALDIDHATAIDREAERMLRTQGTADHKEAARAFVEKRPPEFQGR